MPDPLKRHEPLHIQIYRQYRAMIAAGELAPGDKLPSIRQMESVHGVAHNTAYRAVELLTSRGLAVTSRGPRGTTVAEAGPELARQEQAEVLPPAVHGR